MLRALASATLCCTALLAGATSATAITPDGDVVALVIDTGINPNHQEFAPGQLVGFFDFSDGRTPAPGQRFDPLKAPYDPDGHGTATAAMVGALNVSSEQTPSAAPGIKLASAKVADDDGAIVGDVAAAIRWGVRTLKADAINISIGTIIPTGPTFPLVLDVDEYDALREARAAGVLVTVANGNGTGNAGVVPGDGASSSPSSSMDVLSVGASGIDGPLVSQNPELAAQYTVRVPTPEGTDTYRDISGTSFSSPFTLGFAARLMQELVAARRTMSVADLERFVKATTRDTVIGPQTEGYGVLDLELLPGAIANIRAGTFPSRPTPDPSAEYVETVANGIRATNNGLLPGEYEDGGADAPVADGFLAPEAPPAGPTPPPEQPVDPTPPPAPPADPGPTTSPDPAPTAAAKPDPGPSASPDPAPPTERAASPDPAPAGGAPVLSALRARTGSRPRLELRIDRRSALTIVVRRGATVVRRVRVARTGPGAVRVGLGARLPRGSYRVTVAAVGAAGSAVTRATALRVR